MATRAQAARKTSQQLLASAAKLTTVGTLYGLYDPRTNDLRYVGFTTRDIPSRLRTHRWHVKQKPCLRGVKAWWRSLWAIGLEPVARVLKEGAGYVDEIRAIAEMSEAGFDLLNLSKGGLSGNGGAAMSDLNRSRVAARQLGKPLAPEARDKIAAATRKRMRTPEGKAAAAVGLLRHLQDPVRAKAAAQKAAETRRLNPKPFVPRPPVSDETRRRMSVAAKNRKKPS